MYGVSVRVTLIVDIARAPWAGSVITTDQRRNTTADAIAIASLPIAPTRDAPLGSSSK